MANRNEKSELGGLFDGFFEGPVSRRIIGTGKRRAITLFTITAVALGALGVAQGHDNAVKNGNIPQTPPAPTTRR